MSVNITSIGPPPERHADRVVAEMLRRLAETRAQLWPAIREAIDSSSDGSPKAQRKMAKRIERAGALDTVLTSGKRGHYKLAFYYLNKEIMLGDAIPERPWIAAYLNLIEGKGNGRWAIDLVSAPMVFVTHHALSRTAQRFGARTTEHLLTAALAIWNGAMTLANEMGIEKWLDAPPQGWRTPIETEDNSSVVVVLKRHERRRALIAVTVLAARREQHHD